MLVRFQGVLHMKQTEEGPVAQEHLFHVPIKQTVKQVRTVKGTCKLVVCI